MSTSNSDKETEKLNWKLNIKVHQTQLFLSNKNIIENTFKDYDKSLYTHLPFSSEDAKRQFLNSLEKLHELWENVLGPLLKLGYANPQGYLKWGVSLRWTEFRWSLISIICCFYLYFCLPQDFSHQPTSDSAVQGLFCVSKQNNLLCGCEDFQLEKHSWVISRNVLTLKAFPLQIFIWVMCF